MAIKVKSKPQFQLIEHTHRTTSLLLRNETNFIISHLLPRAFVAACEDTGRKMNSDSSMQNGRKLIASSAIDARIRIARELRAAPRAHSVFLFTIQF